MTNREREQAEAVVGLADNQRWVPGYIGRYYLDDAGDIYSLARTFTRSNRGREQVVRAPGRKLSPGLTRKGYKCIALHADNKSRTFEMHRLVCRTFHGEPGDGFEAAHLNGVRTDNRPANLSWKTRKANMADKLEHGTQPFGENHQNAKITGADAAEIIRLRASGLFCREISRRYPISERGVRKIVNGETWAAETLHVRQILQEKSNG